MQVVEIISGGMDKTVLERMVKIMSYMRGTGSKPGKLKKKERQLMREVERPPLGANDTACIPHTVHNCAITGSNATQDGDGSCSIEGAKLGPA